MVSDCLDSDPEGGPGMGDSWSGVGAQLTDSPTVGSPTSSQTASGVTCVSSVQPPPQARVFSRQAQKCGAFSLEIKACNKSLRFKCLF